mgnify:CR=1 FL=1
MPDLRRAGDARGIRPRPRDHRHAAIGDAHDLARVRPAIEVVTEEGSNLPEGSPEVLDATVTQKLSDEPAAWVVTVRWGVVSSDGPPNSNEYTFTVETAPVSRRELTTTNTPSADDETAEPSASSTDSGYGDIHSQPSTNLDALPVWLSPGSGLSGQRSTPDPRGRSRSARSSCR